MKAPESFYYRNEDHWQEHNAEEGVEGQVCQDEGAYGASCSGRL